MDSDTWEAGATRSGVPGEAGTTPEVVTTGGLQIRHGLYLAAAWTSGMSILLFASERHHARWYFAPVFVT
jgi:hypothetical protein